MSEEIDNRKVILYISMSLDGFIATKDDDLSWLSIVEQKGEDYGYGKFTENVDTYIVGSKTYETILKLTGGNFPQSSLYDCYVITRRNKEKTKGITFYNGNLHELINMLKKKKGKNIYCDGGAKIVNLLMEKNLIDEYIISVIPIILGDGIRLFSGEISRINIQAVSSKKYDSGLIQLHYKRIEN
jgi:dihydrofolate reductase